MKTERRLFNSIVLFLLILTTFGSVFAMRGGLSTVFADSIPKLSNRKFTDALTDMTAEYDKNVTQRQAERDPYISERLIVKSTDENLDPDDYGAVDAIHDRNGTYILQFDSSIEAKRAAQSIAEEDSTVYVEPDGYLFACDFSDSLNEDLWGASAAMIGADQYAESLTGSAGSVEVAVLDTGISFTSPKLAGRLDTVRAKSFATYEGDLLYVDQSQDSSTELKARHGTHVAGIIVQCTEALPNIAILPVRVLNNKGSGYVSQVANGIRYAADQGASVINMSLSNRLTVGGETIRLAVDYAISRGAVVVVVSGNDGQNVADITPGNLEECIVVGAVNSNKSRWYSSNYGSTVDLVAPGVNVYSTSWENVSNGYNSLTGTSMAAPHAAAAAAMLKLSNSSYSPAEIEHLLQTHVLDLGDSGKDNYYGYGMVDLTTLLDDENPDEELDEWNAQNQQAADAVIAMIDALPSPVTLADKEAVEAARAAYDALTYTQKQLVTNLSVLEAAEAAIAQAEAEVDAVISQIAALPSQITLADKDAVEAARAAYDALTDAQKQLVTNLSTLEDAEAAIAQAEAEVNQAAADVVIEQINALPSPVTLADKDAVEAARAAYDALTDPQKQLVTNLSTLEDAEAAIAQAEEEADNQAAADVVIEQINALPSPVTLADKDAVEAARAAYDALTDAQKLLVTNLSTLETAESAIVQAEEEAADQAAADAVINQINALPSQITLADKDAVEAVRAAYDALTEEQKALVTNLSVLEQAESVIEQAEAEAAADQAAADAVINQINALPSQITLADKDAVEAARAAYEALTEEQKALVTNLSVLEATETALQKAIDEEQSSTEKETEHHGSDKRRYPGTNPKPNVTYTVPLKTKQKTKKLMVTGLAGGDKVISWQSSNKKRAKVTGKPDGTCTIKAGKKTGKVSITAVTASGRKVIFKLRVRNNKVKTKKLETQTPTITIRAGEQVRLETERNPITSIEKKTYSSKNKGIVTVTKKGVIKGIAPGSTKITVRCGKAKLRIQVIVY